MANSGTNLIEYAAGYVRIADEGTFYKLFDTLPIYKPVVSVFSKDKAMQAAKELGKLSGNDLP